MRQVYWGPACLAMIILIVSGCSSVSGIRLKAGYGPFNTEIEILLRQADACKKAHGEDCPQAAELERKAVLLGAIPAE